MSTRTAPRRRSATSWNWARCAACSAMRSARMSMSLDQVGDRPSARRRRRGGERSSASSRMRDQIVPPTLNLDNPSESCAGVDLVPHVAKKRKVQGGAQQQLRLWRHQCQPGDEGGLGSPPCAARAASILARRALALALVADGVRSAAGRGAGPLEQATTRVVVPDGATLRGTAERARSGRRDPIRRALPARRAAVRRQRRDQGRRISHPGACQQARHPRDPAGRQDDPAASSPFPRACRRSWSRSG